MNPKKKDREVGFKKLKEGETGNLLKYLRDPKFPKPALTALVVFKRVKLEEVRKEQPHLLMIQMLRLVNEEWELMSGKERS